MKTWRTILSWDVDPTPVDQPRIGDRVKFIASPEELEGAYELPGRLFGKIGTVVKMYRSDTRFMSPEEVDDTIAVELFPRDSNRYYVPTEHWQLVLQKV